MKNIDSLGVSTAISHDFGRLNLTLERIIVSTSCLINSKLKMQNCARCLIIFFAVFEILGFLAITILSAVAGDLLTGIINLDSLMDLQSRNFRHQPLRGYDTGGLDRQYFNPKIQDENMQDPNIQNPNMQDRNIQNPNIRSRDSHPFDFLLKAIRGYSVITLLVCIAGIVGVTILQEHIIIMYMLKVCLLCLWHLFTLIDFLIVFSNGSSKVTSFKNKFHADRHEQYLPETNYGGDDNWDYLPLLIIKVAFSMSLVFDALQILLLFLIVRGLRKVKKIIARGETGEE